MVTARILLSDAETPAALAVARSLGRAGHRVSVLASSRHAPAAASRFVRSVHPTPDAERCPDGWTEVILGLVRARNFDLFLPLTDTALLLADRARADLERHTRPVLPEPGRLDPTTDKRAVLSAAAARGVPTLPALEGEAIASAALPAVLKPGRSRVLSGGRVRRATARIHGDRAALARGAERLAASGLGAYVEPWVSGEGRGIFLLLSDGEVLARFAHRRIREASPLGGPSAVAVAVAPDPALLRHAEEIARALRIEGPMMAEFRGTPEGFVLLEVNARYWGSLPLAIAAGVDFPALHVASLLGEPARGPDRYAVGVRARNLAFDLRHLFGTLRGRPRRLDVPWPSPVAAIRDLLGERATGMVHADDDPAPSRAHALRLVGRSIGHG